MIHSIKNSKIFNYILIFFICQLVNLIIKILVPKLMFADIFDFTNRYLSLTLSSLIALFLLILFINVPRKIYLELGGIPPENLNWSDLFWDLMIYLVAVGINAGLTILSSLLFINTTTNNAPLWEVKSAEDWIWFLSYMLFISFVAPYLEEYIYRGALNVALPFFETNWPAMIITSSLFVLAHRPKSIFDATQLSVLSIAFYIAYARKGNINDSIFIHTVNNFSTTFLMVSTMYLPKLFK